MRTNKRICLAVLTVFFVVALVLSVMPVLAFAKTDGAQSDVCNIQDASPVFEEQSGDGADNTSSNETGDTSSSGETGDTTSNGEGADDTTSSGNEKQPVEVDEDTVTLFVLGVIAVLAIILIISIMVALSRR